MTSDPLVQPRIVVRPKRVWVPVSTAVGALFAWIAWRYDDPTLYVPAFMPFLSVAWGSATGSLVLDRDHVILRHPPLRPTTVQLNAEADCSWKRSSASNGAVPKRLIVRGDAREIDASTWFWSDMTVLARKAQSTIFVAKDESTGWR